MAFDTLWFDRGVTIGLEDCINFIFQGETSPEDGRWKSTLQRHGLLSSGYSVGNF